MVFEVIRGHSIPKLGVFGVIGGQNSKFFKPGQTICKSEALGPVINIKLFLRSSEVIRPQIGGILGHLRSTFKEGLEEETIPPIASSEARG